MSVLGVRSHAINLLRWLQSIHRAEEWFQAVKANEFTYQMPGAEVFGKSSIQYFSQERHRHEQEWRQREFRIALDRFCLQAELHIREERAIGLAAGKAA